MPGREGQDIGPYFPVYMGSFQMLLIDFVSIFVAVLRVSIK